MPTFLFFMPWSEDEEAASWRDLERQASVAS